MKKYVTAIGILFLALPAFCEPRCYTDDKGQFLYLDVKETSAMFSARLIEPSPNDFRCNLYGELAKNNSEFRGVVSEATLPDLLPCTVSVRESKSAVSVEMLSDSCVKIFECGDGVTNTPRAFDKSKTSPLSECQKPEEYMGEGGGTKPDRSTYAK